jgi:hypothetical protein
MACSNWDENGLLYSSKELDSTDALQFEEHLCVCKECKEELELYKKEQVQFYTLKNLVEAPSDATNAEILRVCAHPQKRVAMVGFLPLFFKKAAYSVSFFIIGFTVIGYFAMNIDKFNSSTQQIVVDKNVDSSSIISVSALDSLQSDSSKDSTNRYFSKTRGNLNSNGVFPVDLKGK